MVPMRTCLGCGARRPQPELLALAVDQEGRLVADPARRRLGRHGYCCQNRQCLQRLCKNRKRTARAFRLQVLEYDEELATLFGSKE